jgi:hypothetical protein
LALAWYWPIPWSFWSSPPDQYPPREQRPLWPCRARRNIWTGDRGCLLGDDCVKNPGDIYGICANGTTCLKGKCEKDAQTVLAAGTNASNPVLSKESNDPKRLSNMSFRRLSLFRNQQEFLIFGRYEVPYRSSPPPFYNVCSTGRTHSDVEELIGERGPRIDHSPVNR